MSKFSLDLEQKQVEGLIREAEAQDRSRAWIVRRAIQEFLDRRLPEPSGARERASRKPQREKEKADAG